ncbi:MAG: alpha/beta hydrolase [Chloroflexi bacterium]|nr:alpha/beta hydrolase [Chloroflexota bacterium]
MKHFDLGGTGAPLHFLHANGYPPDCYKPLFEILQTEYRVFGMHLRPLWPDAKMDELKDWHPLSDDLLRFLSIRPERSRRTSASTSLSAEEPIIGVGHSIGGIVTLRAALRDPQKFRALVLLDPVLFPPHFIATWNLARLLGVGYRIHPLIPSTLKRRREFDNLELVFRGYRNRKIFRYFSDENLRAYITGMTRPKADGGYELIFSPEWEAHIYYTGVWRDMELWRDLKNLQVPTLIIRGAETDTFWESAAKLVKRKQAKVRIEAVSQSTHLVPLERPREVFEIMQSFLNGI